VKRGHRCTQVTLEGYEPTRADRVDWGSAGGRRLELTGSRGCEGAAKQGGTKVHRGERDPRFATEAAPERTSIRTWGAGGRKAWQRGTWLR